VSFKTPVNIYSINTLFENTKIEIVKLRLIGIDDFGERHTFGKSFSDGDRFDFNDFFKEVTELPEEINFTNSSDFAQDREEGLAENDEIFNPVIGDINEVMVEYLLISTEKSLVEKNIKPLIKKLNGQVTEWKYKDKSLGEALKRGRGDWVPSYGYSYINASSIGTNNRYSLQRLIWNNNWPFTRWHTYEHDFFLNNYSNNRGTYLSREVNRFGFPVCSWSSNFPSAYLDTRFFDENDWDYDDPEVAYTIGCGNAFAIRGNKSYFTYMRVAKGDVNYDKGKLNAQDGTQIPVNCTSVWCSFSTQNEKLVSAWNVRVPGLTYWSH
jgi:hypothetical protein